MGQAKSMLATAMADSLCYLQRRLEAQPAPSSATNLHHKTWRWGPSATPIVTSDEQSEPYVPLTASANG